MSSQPQDQQTKFTTNLNLFIGLQMQKSPASESQIPCLTERKTTRIKTEITPEKRVRLRDYLFIASTSSNLNNERKKKLNTPKAQKLPSTPTSSSQLRKQKYEITNTQIQAIVKKEIEKQYRFILSEVQTRLDLLLAEEQSQKQVENEDMVDLYNIKRILSDRIMPAIREINEVVLRKESKMVKEAFCLGKLIANTIPEETNVKESRVIEIQQANAHPDSHNLNTSFGQRKPNLSIQTALI